MTMGQATVSGSGSKNSSQAEQQQKPDKATKAPDIPERPVRQDKKKESSTPTAQRGNDDRSIHDTNQVEAPKPRSAALPADNADGQGTGLRDLHNNPKHNHSPESGETTKILKMTREGEDIKKPKTGILGSWGAMFSYNQDSEGGKDAIKYIDRLEVKHQETTKELERAIAHIRKLETKLKSLIQAFNEQKSEIKGLLEERSDFEHELTKTKRRLETAKKEIEQQEAVVNNVRTKQIYELASDVSTEFPDDKVREALGQFFQGEFLSWCSDLCVLKIESPEKVMENMISMGLLNNSNFYLTAAEFLKLDLKMGDGEASLPLLQAALSSFLCSRFLASPYFLADMSPDLMENSNYSGSSALNLMESTFSKVQPDAAIDWRINTIEALEKSTPMTTEAVEYLAKGFVQRFRFLIDASYDADKEAEGDLIKIIVTFATLALKLWKKRGNIWVGYLPRFANEGFQWKSPEMDADAQALSILGSQTQDRPIGLFMRPVIVSLPMGRTGQQKEPLVWLKALAWVSSADGDEMMRDSQVVGDLSV